MHREYRKRYREDLSDPRWRDFSNHIIACRERCWTCGESDPSLLQVHHLIYKDCHLWEYDGDEIRLLCKDCHSAVHRVADLIWVACLRLETHEAEAFLKKLNGERYFPDSGKPFEGALAILSKTNFSYQNLNP